MTEPVPVESQAPESLPTVAPAPDAEAVGALSPMLDLVKQGVSIEAIKEAFALYREEREYRARQAYADAMHRFQHARPTILKNRTARKSTDAGAPKLYSYADLDAVVSAIRGPLHEHGFSFSWTAPVFDDRGVTISCRVLHASGHHEDYPITMPPIQGTSLMNAAQVRGALLTYAQRYSLIAALGLTSCEEDTDATAPVGGLARVTQEQAADLERTLASTGADRAGWLAALDVKSVAAIPASTFKIAMKMLESKRSKA